jgi:hypothetical protein
MAASEVLDMEEAAVRGRPAIAAPQARQNLVGAVFSTPHLGHFSAKGRPQSPQNLVPEGFSEPHFEQSISA